MDILVPHLICRW